MAREGRCYTRRMGFTIITKRARSVVAASLVALGGAFVAVACGSKGDLVLSKGAGGPPPAASTRAPVTVVPIQPAIPSPPSIPPETAPPPEPKQPTP